MYCLKCNKHIIDCITDEDREKFEKCQDHRQIGYLCDTYPICKGCSYQISDEIYIALGGKMVK